MKSHSCVGWYPSFCVLFWFSPGTHSCQCMLFPPWYFVVLPHIYKGSDGPSSDQQCEPCWGNINIHPFILCDVTLVNCLWWCVLNQKHQHQILFLLQSNSNTQDRTGRCWLPCKPSENYQGSLTLCSCVFHKRTLTDWSVLWRLSETDRSSNLWIWLMYFTSMHCI